jgi:hypothetical protein
MMMTMTIMGYECIRGSIGGTRGRREAKNAEGWREWKYTHIYSIMTPTKHCLKEGGGVEREYSGG